MWPTTHQIFFLMIGLISTLISTICMMILIITKREMKLIVRTIGSYTWEQKV